MHVLVEAARPRTLVAGIVPVLVGTGAARVLVPWRFAASLVVALAIQVGTNYANDYFDALRGVDTPGRVGPRRATASGLVSRPAMRAAIAVAFGVAILAGVPLAAAAGWWLLSIGALSILAGLTYSGGPRPYGAAGFGEVFVFLFFGLVATVGAAYIQAGRFLALAAVAAIPVGLLATAILVANNVRDIDTDRAAGKITLAVRIGRTRSRALFLTLLVGAFLYVPAIAVLAHRPMALLPMAAIPLAAGPARLVVTRDDPPGLIRALGSTARLHLAFGVLLAVGLWI